MNMSKEFLDSLKESWNHGEDLKITYELYGVKVTVEVPLDKNPQLTVGRLMDVAGTVCSLRDAYKAMKNNK